MTKIEPEALEKIYQMWRETHGYKQDLYYSVHRISFGYSPGKDFDRWVFQQGGFISAKNGKRHILFTEDKDAMMFLLKWQ